jgi:outer membrane murein-binding lipoprotein Lpp
MIEYAKNWLETTLGKGVLAVAGVFVAGAVAMAKLPDYVVSPRDLEDKVNVVKSDVTSVKMAQESAQRALAAQVIELRIDLLKQQRRQIADKPRPSAGDVNALKEIDEDIKDLRKRLERLKV